MLIGELAKTLGVTAKTLRHYERIGLIPAPERSPGGYRSYSGAAVERARLVVGLRRLDLSLDAVRNLLEDAHDGRTLRQRLMGRLDEKLSEVDLEISVLQGKRDDLQARYDGLLQTPTSRVGTCICGALLRPCTCADAREG